jgi:alpha-galactosidase
MDVALQSDDLEFVLNLPSGRWALHSRHQDFPVLDGALFGAAWRSGMANRRWTGGMQDAHVTELANDAAPETRSRSLLIEHRVAPDVGLSLEFGLGLDVPTLFWRVLFENHSTRPVRLERIDMLRLAGSSNREGHHGLSSGLRLQSGAPDLAFFSNGWESWNFTGALGRSDRFPRTRLGPLSLPMSRGAVSRQPRGRGNFTSEMFGVVGDRVSRLGLLLGFISQRQAFGGMQVDLASVGPEIHMWSQCDGVMLDEGGGFSTDWCCLEFIHLDDEKPLDNYLTRVARANGARSLARSPVGWCSWYQFFQKVTADDVYTNLKWAEDHRTALPLDVVQLDDGFASEVGDWYSMSSGFPSGVSEVAQRIRAAGSVPGLWLAPFVAKPGAQILREHPDWILRTRRGAPANAGFIWDTFTRALDVTHPQVGKHVEGLISTAVDEWGFDYLKLDFLYAGALRGVRHDSHQTRAQALRSILERIRSAAGERRTLVGCGCPLGSGIGVFDAMRIGPDVAPTWEPVYRGVSWALRREPGLPSARNAIHNTVTRAPLHRRWWTNDPDCLILRGEEGAPAGGPLEATPADGDDVREPMREDLTSNASRLTWEETKTLATVIALSGGSLFVSDHLPDLPEGRLEWLARLLPPLPDGFRCIDWFDQKQPGKLVLPLTGPAGRWFLIGLINWADAPADLTIDLRSLQAEEPFTHAVDFWNQAYIPLDGDNLEVRQVAPHGARLFGIRPREAPQWLGDTLHISQGLAVSSMRTRRHELRANLGLERHAAGNVWLELPAPPRRASLDGQTIRLTRVATDVYVCHVLFEGNGRLEVGW